MSSWQDLENEQDILKSKLAKVKSKLEKHETFLKKMDAALNAGLGVGGLSVARSMTLREEVIPMLIIRGNEMILRLRVLRELIPRLRQQERCKQLKEDIIAGALHPKRIEKMLEFGGFEALECF